MLLGQYKIGSRLGHTFPSNLCFRLSVGILFGTGFGLALWVYILVLAVFVWAFVLVLFVCCDRFAFERFRRQAIRLEIVSRSCQ